MTVIGMPAVRSPLSSRWCFTINNPTMIVPFEDLHERISYIVYQLESGSQGTNHIQGYLELSGSRVRRTWLVNNVPFLSGAFVDVAKGTAAQNKTYCTKEPREYGPWETGTAVEPVGAGARNDLVEIMALIEAGHSNFELCRSNPMAMARYGHWINNYRSLYLESLVVITPYVPRLGWQMNLSSLLDLPVNRRKVIWYWSDTGEEGKSYFANHYSPKTSHVITGGKHADIYYTLSEIIHGLKVVFFDYGRSGNEPAYPVMEKLKDGMFTSTKYESRTVRFNSVHVVVFSNKEPDRSQLSEDRWIIKKID